MDQGKINFNLDLNLKIIKLQIMKSMVLLKTLTLFKILILKNASFIYVIKENGGEIDNIRAFVNGFQINSGNIKYENMKSLKINGKIFELNLSKMSI